MAKAQETHGNNMIILTETQSCPTSRQYSHFLYPGFMMHWMCSLESVRKRRTQRWQYKRSLPEGAEVPFSISASNKHHVSMAIACEQQGTSTYVLCALELHQNIMLATCLSHAKDVDLCIVMMVVVVLMVVMVIAVAVAAVVVVEIGLRKQISSGQMRGLYTWC